MQAKDINGTPINIGDTVEVVNYSQPNMGTVEFIYKNQIVLKTNFDSPYIVCFRDMMVKVKLPEPKYKVGDKLRQIPYSDIIYTIEYVIWDRKHKMYYYTGVRQDGSVFLKLEKALETGYVKQGGLPA